MSTKKPSRLSFNFGTGTRGTNLLLAIATVVITLILYQCVLAPYVQNFFALNHSLKSQQALFNNKTLQTHSLQTNTKEFWMVSMAIDAVKSHE